MFGLTRHGIQVKGVEEYFEREHRRAERARKRAARRGIGRAKRFIAAMAVLLLIVALVAVAGTQQWEISRIEAKRQGEIVALTERAATLSAELDKSGKEVEVLKERVASLNKELEAEQAERVKMEAALRESIADRKKASKPSV